MHVESEYVVYSYSITFSVKENVFEIPEFLKCKW